MSLQPVVSACCHVSAVVATVVFARDRKLLQARVTVAPSAANFLAASSLLYLPPLCLISPSPGHCVLCMLLEHDFVFVFCVTVLQPSTTSFTSFFWLTDFYEHSGPVVY